MSTVYQEKPNIVQVTIIDETGSAERFIVGKSLDQVIEQVTGEKLPEWVGQKKTRKPRRTKAQMATSTEEAWGEQKTATEVPPPHAKKEVWP